ncbi:MAG: outer membrane beta-barrel domain-containing protein [Bdellovibrionaceae bacterium]|nr:outer membrane beta-barrel domain-containing protein [Pseudobdellovibrionaceae bacterium]
MKIVSLMVLALCCSYQAQAITIEFPEEELAKESVLPVFEGETKAVMSRRVITKERFEVGPMVGFIFNEPFFSPLTYGIHAGYHFNEFHSVAVNAFLRNASISSDAKQVDKDIATEGSQQIINFSVVPVPDYLVTVDYQLTPYYGKISLTKDFVMNLGLYVYGGVGAMGLGGATAPLLDLGVGQNLFFTSRFGLRLDMKFLMYQGLNVTSKTAVTSAATSKVDPGIFDKQFNVSPSVMLGVVFLL